ncbi:MAG: DciA family protein, partial [Candidatus Cryptobacteroides sp.]
RGLNSHKVFTAWDEVSGAGSRTIGRSFRNGILYCSLSSAVLRSELKFRLPDIRRQINERLAADKFFIRSDGDPEPVKNIVLK